MLDDFCMNPNDQGTPESSGDGPTNDPTDGPTDAQCEKNERNLDHTRQIESSGPEDKFWKFRFFNRKCPKLTGYWRGRGVVSF